MDGSQRPRSLVPSRSIHRGERNFFSLDQYMHESDSFEEFLSRAVSLGEDNSITDDLSSSAVANWTSEQARATYFHCCSCQKVVEVMV